MAFWTATGPNTSPFYFPPDITKIAADDEIIVFCEQLLLWEAFIGQLAGIDIAVRIACYIDHDGIHSP